MMFFQPTRDVCAGPQPGTVTVRISPPDFLGLASQTLVLTDDQFERAKLWLDGKALIQQALPDLTPGQRELLITGITEERFAELFGPEEE